MLRKKHNEKKEQYISGYDEFVNVFATPPIPFSYEDVGTSSGRLGMEGQLEHIKGEVHHIREDVRNIKNMMTSLLSRYPSF